MNFFILDLSLQFLIECKKKKMYTRKHELNTGANALLAMEKVVLPPDGLMLTFV